MDLGRARGQQCGPRIEAHRNVVQWASVVVGRYAARLIEDQQRPGEVEGANRRGRCLERDPAGGGVAEVQRGGAKLADFLRLGEDGRGPLPRFDAAWGVEGNHWDKSTVKGGRARLQRHAISKGAPAMDGVEL